MVTRLAILIVILLLTSLVAGYLLYDKHEEEFIPIIEEVIKGPVDIIAECIVDLSQVCDEVAIEYARLIYSESQRYGYDWKLVLAIVYTESSFDHLAKSCRDATGLMQVRPQTAKWILDSAGLEYNHEMLINPTVNLKLGLHYLRMLELKYDGDLDRALIAYNRGPNSISKGRPYLDKVISRYDNIREWAQSHEYE